MGMADSHLQLARRVVARALAPEAGGKDPNLVLHFGDGPSGTADPAFDAHYQPVMQFCTCMWQSWQPLGKIDDAIRDARVRINAAKISPWQVVTGPISAMLASLDRLKWHVVSSQVLVDDQGTVFNTLRDPPVVIGAAVKQAVRRWRTAQVLLKFPSAVPEHPCYIAPTMDPQWLHDDGLLPQGLVDPVGNISSLLKKSVSKQFAPWDRAAGPYLKSAFTGGQWTQARKAQVFSERVDCTTIPSSIPSIFGSTQVAPANQMGGSLANSSNLGGSQTPQLIQPPFAEGGCISSGLFNDDRHAAGQQSDLSLNWLFFA